MSRKPVVLLPAFLLAAVLASACGDARPSAAAAADTATPDSQIVDVAVARATIGTVESALEISGTLGAHTRVGVKPKLPGRLERVLVDVGDRVTAGQVVATLDRREVDALADAADAAVGVSKAGLESAEAGLAQAVLEHDRAKNLFDRGALPRQHLEVAGTSHRSAVAQRDLAQATVAQSEATLRRAREVQRDTTLHAPISGRIVERHYDPGAIPGEQPIVVVADLREVKLEAGVSELEVGRLSTGLPVVVSVPAKPAARYAGVLAVIAPEVDPRNRHFRVQVRINNPDGALLAGMYATARIVIASATDAVTLPRESVTTRNGQRVVLKLDGHRLMPVAVVEGLTDGHFVQILSGVAAGDQVLADARRQMPADARVRPVLQSRPSN
jgi:RND family efflux transporter MFP subunit